MKNTNYNLYINHICKYSQLYFTFKNNMTRDTFVHMTKILQNLFILIQLPLINSHDNHKLLKIIVKLHHQIIKTYNY